MSQIGRDITQPLRQNMGEMSRIHILETILIRLARHLAGSSLILGKRHIQTTAYGRTPFVILTGTSPDHGSADMRRDNQDENRATIRMRMRRRGGDEGRA